MNKKYIWYQLKQWIPYAVVSLLVLACFFWTEMSTTQLAYHNSEYGHAYYTGNSGLLGISIPSLIMASIIPLIVFSYRYSKNRADTFSQIPFREREFKAIRLVLALIILVLNYTFVYWIGIMILGIREANMGIVLDNYIKVNFNYLAYFGSYWLLLLFLILQYFISAYLIQLGNRPFDSIVYLVLGQLILLLPCYSIYFYVNNVGSTGANSYIWFDGSIVNAIIDHYAIFNNLCTGMSSSPIIFTYADEVVSLVGYILVGLAAGFFSFYLKDPSGEYYGKSGYRNVFISVIPHVAFFLTGVTLSGLTLLGFMSFVIFFVLWSVSYFMTIVYLNRGFKLKKLDWIPMSSVAVVMFFLSMFASFY